MTAAMVLANLKRLAGNKALLILLVLSPMLLMAAFASVIAPVFFAGGLDSFEVAVVNHDSGALTGEIIRGLVENEKTRGLVSARAVADEPQGRQALAAGAAALITVPAGFQETLESGGQGTLFLQLNPSKTLEGALLRDVLAAGVTMVNDAQTGVNALYHALVSGGMPLDEAAIAYNGAAREFLIAALDRGAAIAVEGELSPLGRLLPVEYYASALLAFFLCLGAMGIAALAADDAANCVLERHLSSGRGYGSYAVSRILAGTVLVTLQGIPAIGLILLISSSAFVYSGAVALALPALILIALAVSSGGVWAGMMLKKRQTAMTAVFVAVAALAVLGGALIPASGLGALSALSPYTPVNASMRLLSNTLFFYDMDDFVRALLVISVFAALCFAASCRAVRRRT